MSTAYVWGAVCGIAVVALAGLLAGQRMKRKYSGKCKYDERQIAAQGRAYKCAYFTLLIYLLVYGIICAMDIIWCETMVGVFTGIVISIAVFAVICIFEDAYFKTFESPRAYILMFTFIGLANVLLGVLHMVDGDFIENGIMGINSMNFIAGLLLLVVDATVLIKRMRDRRAEETE